MTGNSVILIGSGKSWWKSRRRRCCRLNIGTCRLVPDRLNEHYPLLSQNIHPQRQVNTKPQTSSYLKGLWYDKTIMTIPWWWRPRLSVENDSGPMSRFFHSSACSFGEVEFNTLQYKSTIENVIPSLSVKVVAWLLRQQRQQCRLGERGRHWPIWWNAGSRLSGIHPTPPSPDRHARTWTATQFHFTGYKRDKVGGFWWCRSRMPNGVPGIGGWLARTSRLQSLQPRMGTSPTITLRVPVRTEQIPV